MLTLLKEIMRYLMSNDHYVIIYYWIRIGDSSSTRLRSDTISVDHVLGCLCPNHLVIGAQLAQQ